MVGSVSRGGGGGGGVQLEWEWVLLLGWRMCGYW